jgi:hypothetical protein
LEFAELMQTGAIVPFVTNKLLNDADFQKHPEGAKALELLLPKLKHATMVSFAADQASKSGKADPLGTSFTTMLAGLGNLNAESTILLLRELGAPVEFFALGRRGLIDRFDRRIHALAAMAQEKLSTKPVQNLLREEIYQSFFCVKGQPGESPVTQGRFLPEMAEDHSLILLKKLVDMVYNFNLPDHLDRSSLTSQGMSGRTPMELVRTAALGQSAIHSKGAGIGKNEERLLESAARINAKYLNRAIEVTLPNLERITIKDLHRIRKDKKWTDFIESKRELLEVRSADALPEAFDEFVHRHQELHKTLFLINAKSVLPEKVARVAHFIDSPLLKLAGAAASLAGLDTVSDFAEIFEAMPKEAAFEFGMSWTNEKREKLQSTMAFHSIQKFEVATRTELSELKKNSQGLDTKAQNGNNEGAEQSRP